MAPLSVGSGGALGPLGPTKAAMVSCVRLARDLGLRVVAEGVETREMLEFMTWLKVDETQGFLLSKPLPPAEFKALLAKG